MSGGSWNYLAWKDVDEVLGQLATMQAMRDRLMELGVEGVVIDDMNRLCSSLEFVHKVGDTPAMRRVWQAVEWHDSGDWAVHRVLRAAWMYGPKHRCDHKDRTEPLQYYQSWKEDGEPKHGHVRSQHCNRCGVRIILKESGEVVLEAESL